MRLPIPGFRAKEPDLSIGAAIQRLEAFHYTITESPTKIRHYAVTTPTHKTFPDMTAADVIALAKRCPDVAPKVHVSQEKRR